MRLLVLFPALLLAQDTATIEGIVTNSVTGAPVRRAFVAIVHGGENSNRTATTDLEGRFTITGLKPGSYSAVATHPAYNPRHGMPPTNFTAVAGLNRLTLKLEPPGAVSGRVLDPDGEPAARAVVQLLRIGWYSGRKKLLRLENASLDDRGVYRIGGLPPGRYYVYVSARPTIRVRHGLLPSGAPRPAPSEAWPALFYPGSTEFTGATPVQIAAGAELDGIDFKLQRVKSVRVQGQITGLTPGSGQWHVEMTPEGSLLDGAGPRVDVRGAAFDAPSVVPGSYLVQALVIDQGRQYVGVLPLQVRSREIDDAVITLSPALDLYGHVRFGREPLAGAQVFLYPREHGRGLEPPKTAADGSFTLTQVLPGEQRVEVMGKGPYYIKRATLGGQAVPTGWFNVPPGSAGPLELEVANDFATASGTVDKPEGAHVVAIRDGLWRSQSVGADGSWRMDYLAPGKYRFAAVRPEMETHPDYAQLLEQRGELFTLEGSGTVTLQLKLLTPP